MLIHIKDQMLQLKPEEVQTSKKLISRMLKTIENSSRKCGQWSFYLTFLIVMHMMSQSLLNEVAPETFERYFPQSFRKKE